MMRTTVNVMLAALALAVLAAPAQADVEGQVENLLGGPVPPAPGCNEYTTTGTRLCYNADEDCIFVAFRSGQVQGHFHGSNC